MARLASATVALLLCASPAVSQTLSQDGVSTGPAIAPDTVSVTVTASRVELAERQIHEQEQQRVFGVLPNFFVTYDPDAVPLTAGQKFELARKSRLDPVQFVVAGAVAGVQQSRDDYSGFGRGWEGYAKRYGAAYANVLTRSLITQALLPSLFRQDPRYFFKGTGSTPSRVGYAISRAVVRKGDNGRWQPNYAGILGSLASGWLSNFYYPEEDRQGTRLTLENTAIGIGGAAVGHLAQEFLFRRLTTHARRPIAAGTPGPAKALRISYVKGESKSQ